MFKVFINLQIIKKEKGPAPQPPSPPPPPIQQVSPFQKEKSKESPTNTVAIPNTNHLLDDDIKITSTPNKSSTQNTSMTLITINSGTVVPNDPFNSLASNVSQVTVVTSHPPVIFENSMAFGSAGKSLIYLS